MGDEGDWTWVGHDFYSPKAFASEIFSRFLPSMLLFLICDLWLIPYTFGLFQVVSEVVGRSVCLWGWAGAVDRGCGAVAWKGTTRIPT